MVVGITVAVGVVPLCDPVAVGAAPPCDPVTGLIAIGRMLAVALAAAWLLGTGCMGVAGRIPTVGEAMGRMFAVRGDSGVVMLSIYVVRVLRCGNKICGMTEHLEYGEQPRSWPMTRFYI